MLWRLPASNICILFQYYINYSKIYLQLLDILVASKFLLYCAALEIRSSYVNFPSLTPIIWISRWEFQKGYYYVKVLEKNYGTWCYEILFNKLKPGWSWLLAHSQYEKLYFHLGFLVQQYTGRLSLVERQKKGRKNRNKMTTFILNIFLNICHFLILIGPFLLSPPPPLANDKIWWQHFLKVFSFR